MLHHSFTHKHLHMGKLSKQWQSARINTTHSTLEVQHKIEASAAHHSLNVFTTSVKPNVSIGLYIIIRFCVTVHLLKHTQCICDVTLNNTVFHLILPSLLSTC